MAGLRYTEKKGIFKDTDMPPYSGSTLAQLVLNHHIKTQHRKEVPSLVAAISIVT